MYNELVNNKIKNIGVISNDYSYGYIENSKMHESAMDKVVEYLSTKFKSNIKICDLGIGLGKKIFYISHKLKDLGINVEVTGIEINEKYFEAIFEMKDLWQVPLKIYRGDMMDHNISQYDFIYLFYPLKNMQPLYRKLCYEMKDGAIVFDPTFQKITFNMVDNNSNMRRHSITDMNFVFHLFEKLKVNK